MSPVIYRGLFANTFLFAVVSRFAALSTALYLSTSILESRGELDFPFSTAQFVGKCTQRFFGHEYHLNFV